jgi:cellulose synthase/poly-beta-1,6-N-acetylglucosamine synthase-like glycosyltransferase
MKIELITILIPARNESEVIGATLQRLLEQGLRPDQIDVIADHCQDDTAQIVSSLGARVWQRGEGGRVGKGPAISWWLRQSRPEADPDGIVIVLDADTGLEQGLVETVAAYFQQEVQVAQTAVQPRRLNDSHIARLASFSEIVEQQVFDALRERLGWSVRLRGTGMAFRRAALEAIGPDLCTSVEDIELTILALQAGYRIAWIDSTCIYDPKPLNTRSASRQRARWLKGQFEVMRRYGWQIWRLLFRGLGPMTLVGSLFLKPRTLFIPIKFILAGLLSWCVIRGGWLGWLIPAFALWLNLVVEVMAYVYGLSKLDNPWPTLRALLLTPLFGLMWLRSAALALFSREAWLRGRDSNVSDQEVTDQ